MPKCRPAWKATACPPPAPPKYVAIYASIRAGALGADYEQHKPPLGRVKLEDFAQEFAAAF